MDTALNWSADRAMSAWEGVAVGGTPRRVTGLSLGSAGLSGIVPVEIGDLTELRRLSLRHNSLTGSVPKELANLTNLTFLALQGNRFDGCIPTALSNIRNLSN